MRLPQLQELPNMRITAETFLGVNYGDKIGQYGSGYAAVEFSDMQNLTGEKYPILSTRRHRGWRNTVGSGNVNGLIIKDALCYVQETSAQEASLYMNDYPILDGLTIGEKKLVGMGAYIVVLPDWKYVNTENFADKGSVAATAKSDLSDHYGEPVTTIEMCNLDGDKINVSSTGDVPPTDPRDGDYWIDTSGQKPVLKKYAGTESIWSAVPTTYVRIRIDDGKTLFNAGDGVTLTNVSGVEGLSGAAIIQNIVIQDTETYFVFIGIASTETVYIDGQIDINRTPPELDFIIESNNRLWGCRYGLNRAGETVNEIYACKQGNFKNWTCYQGVSTDSYAASVGTDGQFTGAATYLGYPIFFKENCIHKVYGSEPANYQIQTTQARGVKRGCSKSIATVDERLIYQSTADFCMYDGSLPGTISTALNGKIYNDTVGCAHAGKYYVSTLDGDKPVFMVYDPKTGLWHVEDDLRVTDMASVDDQLFMTKNGDIITEFGRERVLSWTNQQVSYTNEEHCDTDPIKWSATTGVIGFTSPDKKYITKINARMELAASAQVSVFVQYDSVEAWEHLATFSQERLQTFIAQIRPKRCDHLRLMLVGEGDAKIFGISFTMEGGSDL